MSEHGTAHSQLICDIIERFPPNFTPGAESVYVGVTNQTDRVWNADLLASFQVAFDDYGRMPDVVLYWREKNWLVLVEAATTEGVIDEKRRIDLQRMFAGSSASLIFVTAFPNRKYMGKFLADLAWKTEVWVADAPTHLIHFDGDRFMGPH